MSTKYKTVISNTALIPVKGSLADGDGKQVSFKFSLICKRLGAAELKEQLAGGEALMQEFLQEVTSGWKNQSLVLEEDGKTPAEFNDDSFAALLDIGGMAALCFNAYMKEQSAKEKN